MQIRWTALAAGLCLAFPIAAHDRTSVENAVWQLEEDYWRYVSAGDAGAQGQHWQVGTRHP
jgi:hypothetical protein